MVHHILVDTKNYNAYLISCTTDPTISTIIGKQPTKKKPNQRKLVLNDNTLENNHCAIKTFSQSSLLRRLTSTAHVQVNHIAVSLGTVVIIRNGDQVEIGSTTYQYQIIGGNFIRHLKILKKNKNYLSSTVPLRK